MLKSTPLIQQTFITCLLCAGNASIGCGLKRQEVEAHRKSVECFFWDLGERFTDLACFESFIKGRL